MLYEHPLPTERTLRFLPHPVPNTRPAEDVTARRGARIPHGFETQRAFPLLLSGDPLHRVLVFQVVCVYAFRIDVGMGNHFYLSRLCG